MDHLYAPLENPEDDRLLSGTRRFSGAFRPTSTSICPRSRSPIPRSTNHCTATR